MLKKGAERERVLSLLEASGARSAQEVRAVAEETGVPEAEVWGAATFYSLLRSPATTRRICQGLTCRLAGSGDILAEAREQGEAVDGVSCLGQCDRAPAWLDGNLQVISGDGSAVVVPLDDPELPINLGGDTSRDADYAALERARRMGAEAVLREIETSGLQGRGGAGYPASRKWASVRAHASPVHYLVVNADEGEPGTFKDREILLRRPHRLIEGMVICAETIGCRQVYIYVRGELRAARASLEAALAGADSALEGLDVRVVSGHGAYICGEETALLEALEGKRGMPRVKPPYPTEVGLRGMPTLVHNVETLACVPAIAERGGTWFRQLGRTGPGTKLYCVSGHVRSSGVFELPLGVTLDDVVAAAGGYVGTPRAFSPGGASSGLLPIAERRRPLDCAHLAEVSTILGSGGVVVIDDSVDIARAAMWSLEFFERESCGKCAPCRLGTRYLRRQLARYLQDGDPAAFDRVDDVAWEMEQASICGLGMTAARPLTSAMKYFPEAFGRRPKKTVEEQA